MTTPSDSTVILVHIDAAARDEGEVAEFRILARSAGAEILGEIFSKRHGLYPKYLIGPGKLEELQALQQSTQAQLIIFNHELSPAQVRNLETALQVRVLHRTELILDIFASRAHTFEGKLQVELAQLQHLSTRLVRGWTHLERQKGGIGLRGPGETQLETDRRLVRHRIHAIQERLEQVKKQRHQSRQKRLRSALPVVALVGYTNAGKSSLFNQLFLESTPVEHRKEQGVYVADQLFATLDPTSRHMILGSVGEIVISDTVGFIRRLPHDLVQAFSATLEETAEADLLLYVVDATHPERREHIATVDAVIKEVGAEQVPVLQVFNKIDALEATEPHIDRNEEGLPERVWISALEGAGLDLLKQALTERLVSAWAHFCLILSPREGELRAQLYARRVVLSESQDASGNTLLEIKMPASLLPVYGLHSERE